MTTENVGSKQEASSLHSLVRRWSIRNHLGHEVGTVETEHDPIAAYAVNVNAPSSRLKDAGYTATEAPNDPS